MLERSMKFHTLRLAEYLDPFNPAVKSFLEQAQARFLQMTLEVVRMGACYEQIADILKRHFDWEIPADSGLGENPSGHLQEFALSVD